MKTSRSREICSPYHYIFRRRLGQDQYIRLCHTSSTHLQDVLPRYLQDVFKTSSKTSSRHLQDFFKTFRRRLQDIFKASCHDVFKTSSKRLQDVLKNFFKTSSRRLQDVLQIYLQHVFKTYHQVKLFLLTRL